MTRPPRPAPRPAWGAGTGSPAASSFGRLGPRPGQHHLLGHLPEHGLQRELRHHERCRPADRGGQRPGELGVGDRLRAGQVDRPADLVVLGQEPDRADLVLQRDPREVLLAGADPAAQREPEQRAQPAEQAAGRGQHRGRAQQHHPGPGRGRRRGGRLPVPADLGQEAGAVRAGLVDQPGAGVAVVVDARRVQQRRHPVLGHGLRPAPRWARCGCPGPAACAPRSTAGRRCRRRSRLTTASTPSKVPSSIRPAGGSQPRSSGAAGARRTSRSTSCPAARRWATRAVPIKPDEPATRTRTR